MDDEIPRSPLESAFSCRPPSPAPSSARRPPYFPRRRGTTGELIIDGYSG